MFNYYAIRLTPIVTIRYEILNKKSRIMRVNLHSKGELLKAISGLILERKRSPEHVEREPPVQLERIILITSNPIVFIFIVLIIILTGYFEIGRAHV